MSNFFTFKHLGFEFKGLMSYSYLILQTKWAHGNQIRKGREENIIKIKTQIVQKSSFMLRAFVEQIFVSLQYVCIRP